MDEKWLKDIANQLADYEAKAPEGLWERIDSSLKAGATGPRSTPLTRRTSLRRVAYSAAAIALLTLLIGGGVLYHLNDEQLQPAQELATVLSSSQSPYRGSADEDQMQTLRHQEQSMLGQVLQEQTLQAHAVQEQALQVHAVQEQVDPAQAVQGQAAQKQAVQEQVELEKADTEQQPARKVPNRPTRRSQRGYFVPAAQRTRGKQHPFSISLLASNVFSDNSQTNGPSGVVMSGGDDYLAQDPISNQIQLGYGALDKHLIGNDGARVFDQEKHHKQPVRVGLSVAYPLSERLSIGLGLYYTYLSSDFKSGSEHNYQSAHQSLHYLGIPLSVNYTFLRSSRFSFYATGGMMAEKCISGQSELLTVSGSSREVEKQSLTEQRLQYSAFGSVGVQMDLVKHVGLYVEPGLSYYLDNHSRVVNLYKDEPLQFNLSAGVRFSF